MECRTLTGFPDGSNWRWQRKGSGHPVRPTSRIHSRALLRDVLRDFGLLMVAVRRLVHSAARCLAGPRRHHAPGIARCRGLVMNDALPHAIHTCRSWKSLDTPGRVKARRQRSASEAGAETFRQPAASETLRTIPEPDVPSARYASLRLSVARRATRPRKPDGASAVASHVAVDVI